MKILINFVILSAFCVFSIPLEAQDLTQERIRKITGRKRAIYLQQGIFHNGNIKQTAKLAGIRRSYRRSSGQERLVFDFNTAKVPKVYGHISSKGRRVNIDFFDTQINGEAFNGVKKGHYIDAINFYPVDKEILSCELSFKTEVKVDIFYLESHGRLVVDIQKL